MTPKQEKFIKKYNEYPEDIERVYNKDRGQMLQYIIKMGLLDYVDESLFEDYLDLILYEKLTSKEGQEKIEFSKEIAASYLNSEIVFEGNKIYYDVGRDDLLQIFDDGRDGVRYVAEKILSQDDDWWEPYQDVVDRNSFYNDCVESLTNENKMLLANKLNDDLLDKQISPETELLEEIAEEQGHPEYVYLSTDLIYDRILDDEDTSHYLLLDETEIGNEMMWRYGDAYNQAAIDEYYNEVMNGIKEFFETETPPEPHTNTYKSQYTGKETYYHFLRVDVTKSFLPMLISYLSNWQDANRYSENIDYFGSFTALIKQLLDWGELSPVSFRIDDYVDHRDVEKTYNEIIVGDVI